MSKDRIFELIRKEEVVLFVGAGMSRYAGYPSGEKLSEILYDNLTNDLKTDIDFPNNLPKLAEDISNLMGNKNYLFEILKREFEKKPISVETHQLLAKIPHFKTIITTNYDSLIESTNEQIEVIRKSKDYPIADSKKTLLFKIHSDLSDTEKIILTNSDYNDYFVKSNEYSIFWNAVKDRLASNHILFIGYSMEDSNINVILQKIIGELGDNRKEMFFVSPTISKPKLGFLKKSRIGYIESTGEILINEIYEDLRLNYFTNLPKGEGTADTALNFANSNQINIEISKKDEGIVINNFRSLDKDKNHKIEVKFELPKNEQTKHIIGSFNSKNFDDIHLEGKSLKELGIFLKGFRFKTEEDIQRLIVKKLPFYDCLVDIRFEDGFEIDDYKFKLFAIQPDKNENHLKIEVDDFTIIIKIKFNTIQNNTQYNIEVIPNEVIKSTNSGLKFYTILSKIFSNQKFKIYKENKLLYNYNPKMKFTEDTFDAKLLYNHFQNLKKIEKHFDIRFTNVNIDEAYNKSIKNILAYINKTQLVEQFNGHTFKIENKAEFENFIKSDEEDRILIMSENEKTIIDLYEIQFDLGYLHQIINDVFIENLEDLESNKTSEIKLISKTNSIYIQYSDDANLILQK